MKTYKYKGLEGKWRYTENYGLGTTEGELMLQQEGNRLSGRIIFTDREEGGATSMIQEFLVGEVEERKVKLDAQEFDIIHSEHSITYELDSWFGIRVDENTIKGISLDEQGIEGSFEFSRMEE